jgi:DDE superfamily endonuclease
MPTLPRWIMTVMNPFAQAFWGIETWYRAQEMVVGALLTTGKRTVSAVLRVLGRADEKHYARYHNVLNRAVWSGLEVSGLLLRTVLKTFDTGGPLVFGIDETIERRRGEKIAARGVYRDPVRSSKSHFVKASGLRWISLMWLTPIPFAARIWALPILTVLAPSERYYVERGRSAKSITRFAMQISCQLRRWLPNRTLVIVGDSTYAALELLHQCQTLVQPVTFITRLRMDAALYAPAPAYCGKGRPRKKGARLPTPAQLARDPHTVWSRLTVDWYARTQRRVDLAIVNAVWYHTGLPPVPMRYLLIRDVAGQFDPQALLSTDPTLDPLLILDYFIRRWQMESTFQQVRSHLGVETQRQWSDKAILRTTPALFGLFSLVTVLAHTLIAKHGITSRSAAWYSKALPTFSDALALVRLRLWRDLTFQLSASDPDMVLIPRTLIDRFNDLLAYAV